MGEQLLEVFKEHSQWAFVISLALSVIVALLGVLPSVFITAANILFFGFWEGFLVSFLGEAIGAIVAFLLYRKGFKKAASKPLHKYPQAQRLIEATGKEAFLLIMGLRLLPFVPSGLVTFAAAIGSVNIGNFAIASSIGKIPALFIEAYSVYQVTQFGWQGKVIVGVAAIALLYLAIRKKKV